MNTELAAIKQAIDDQDFATARDLSTNYVTAHPDEFASYVAVVEIASDERAAKREVVKRISVFRSMGMEEDQYRAEAFQLHRWEPEIIGGASFPIIRNDLVGTQPVVRNS